MMARVRKTDPVQFKRDLPDLKTHDLSGILQLPINETTFKMFLKYDIPLFLSVYLRWPNICYESGDMVYMAKDSETIVIFVTIPMVSYSVNGMYRNWESSIVLNHMPLVTEPQALQFMPAVVRGRYLGGDEGGNGAIYRHSDQANYKKAIDQAKNIQAQQQGNHGVAVGRLKSLFICVGLPGEEAYDEDVQDLTGKFPADLCTDTQPQFGTYDAYNKFWGWVENRAANLDGATVNRLTLGIATILCRRDGWYYNAKENRWRHQLGRSARRRAINDPDWPTLQGNKNVNLAAADQVIARVEGMPVSVSNVRF
jgi:hypothetical protein